jgi:tRNA pseudouridine55 synthase
MDGVVVVDKPEGLTSHDVVSAARRLLGERRIGHTGTLDPLATGVLPLVCGRATRLVRFLSAADKQYEATIRFGFTTDTYDITGEETSRTGAAPGREAVLRALDTLTGDYLQMPPAYSAKKVGGRRAYDFARNAETVQLAAVPVRVSGVELKAFEGESATVSLTCSAGFYVRAFACSLGEIVGTGACLAALRRTRSGEFGLDGAVSLDDLNRDDSPDDPSTLLGAGQLASWLIPMEQLLPGLPSLRLTGEGLIRVSHGRVVEAADLVSPGPQDPAYPTRREDPAYPTRRAGPVDPPEWVRLFDQGGALVALATPGAAPGSLHPSVVLI